MKAFMGCIKVYEGSGLRTFKAQGFRAFWG